MSKQLELPPLPSEVYRPDVPPIDLEGFQYYPDTSIQSENPLVNPLENAAMTMCFALAQEALTNGNPPIGAVLIDRSRRGGRTWGAKTTDKTNPRLLAHAEVRVYEDAHKQLADDLSNCTLVTTAEPCVTCSAPYAEGKIGRIILAAPRAAVREVTTTASHPGLMRKRKINMHDIIKDGSTQTQVVSGWRAAEALKLFADWAVYREAGIITG